MIKLYVNQQDTLNTHTIFKRRKDKKFLVLDNNKQIQSEEAAQNLEKRINYLHVGHNAQSTKTNLKRINETKMLWLK